MTFESPTWSGPINSLCEKESGFLNANFLKSLRKFSNRTFRTGKKQKKKDPRIPMPSLSFFSFCWYLLVSTIPYVYLPTQTSCMCCFSRPNDGKVRTKPEQTQRQTNTKNQPKPKINPASDHCFISTMSSCMNLEGDFTVQSDKCKYTDEAIVSDYT